MPSNPLHRALKFALKAHKGQDRDGPDPLPYFVHPVEVVVNLRYVGGVVDGPMLAAAALHDVVESGGAPLEAVAERFGPEVAGLVEELTRTEPTPELAAGLTKQNLQRLRSELLLADVAAMSPEAQTIKLADRLSNLSDGNRRKQTAGRARRLAQTREMLQLIPRAVNPGLWDAVSALLD